MFEFDPVLDLLASLVLALGTIVLGGIGLLGQRRGLRHPSWVGPLTLALLTAIPGLLLAWGEKPSFLSSRLLILASFGAVFAFLRSPLPGLLSRHADMLRCTWVQSTGLVAIGAVLIGCQIVALNRQEACELNESEAALRPLTQPDLRPVPGMSALTDKGRSLPLMQLVSEGAVIAADEAAFIRSLNLELHLIQTAKPDESHNCHGWVFAGGRAWVRGKEVDTILTDNQYRSVSEPAVGDVAVFRDNAGNVAHTALVCSACTNGPILIESKWGKLGRYIHTLTGHAYKHFPCTFYRSPRSGHTIRVISPLSNPIVKQGA